MGPTLAALRDQLRPWILPIAVAIGFAVLLAACAPLAAVSPSAAPGTALPSAPTPTPILTDNPQSFPLAPAQPGEPPVIGLLAWLFTPVFQALFILLVAFEQVTGNMAVAIVIVTLVVRILLIPLYRKQIVSQKRTQLLAPELKEIQRRFKGDRVKVQQATSEFYKERGVNPASGCLPLILQMVLLIPMYSVFNQGLTNVDPNRMLSVFGIQIINLDCGIVPPPHPGPVIACIDSNVLGIDLSQPNVLFTLPILGLGISILAIISALLQLVQSRMALPSASIGVDDQNTKIQRQTMLFVPFISIFYGGFLPAGLFIYWIVSTIFSIVQQYLILGWGGMFPVFGWYPNWAKDHTPRFPVAIPTADPTKRAPTSVLTETDDRAAKAASTVRPRERTARKGRRGRRR
jgi:YidC/Oxa1 family membrane protein insertase